MSKDCYQARLDNHVGPEPEQLLTTCPACNRQFGRRPVLTIAAWKTTGGINPFTDVVHCGACRFKRRPHQDWLAARLAESTVTEDERTEEMGKKAASKQTANQDVDVQEIVQAVVGPLCEILNQLVDQMNRQGDLVQRQTASLEILTDTYTRLASMVADQAPVAQNERLKRIVAGNTSRKQKGTTR